MTYRSSPLAAPAIPRRTPWRRLLRAWADGTLMMWERRQFFGRWRWGAWPPGPGHLAVRMVAGFAATAALAHIVRLLLS